MFTGQQLADYRPEDIGLEPENWEPDELQLDVVYVIDGKGRTVRLEVPDDVADS